MKKKRKINPALIKYVIPAVLVLGAIAAYLVTRAEDSLKVKADASTEEFYESSYQEYLDAQGYDGTMSSSQVPVDLENYTAADGMDASRDDQGVITQERGSITWNFYVEEAGFYNIELSYLPLEGTKSQIKRILHIDGESSHSGLRQLVFNRMFTDSNSVPEVKNKNEVRPKALELFQEQTVYIEDSQRRSAQPYKFYFSGGEHSLTLISVKEPMKITGITLKSMPEIPSYSEVADSLRNRYSVYDGESIVCQAERADGNTLEIIRSSSAITTKNNVTDPNLQPYHPYQVVYNTIGGDSWKSPGDSIQWKIRVPQDGLYKLSVKASQNVKRGVTSYRRLRINGEVPFLEAQSLRFDYSTGMTNYILGDGTQEGAYLFPLRKGENIISMEVVLGEFGETYTQINESLYNLNDLYRRIVQITGTAPDKYIDYEIVKKIPDFVKTVRTEQERLASVFDELLVITGEKGENANLVEKMLIQLKRLEEEPESAALSGELSTFKSNITSLATWLIQIGEMPLEIDSITLLGGDKEPAEAQASFFKQLYNDTIRFFATFFVDNTKVYTEDQVKRDSIKVWIPTGRDQAQVLRAMIDESFTPEYNIGVNLELVPLDVVIPSTLAGIGPDVVLSIDQTKLMDFAMRNALVDLSSLEGFEEERAKYFDSAIEGVTYQDGIYGLPETQMFGMLFYRKDIFDALGLQPPRTWEDFKEIIPVLSMHNYEAYIPTVAPLSSMIFQRGGDVYLGKGKDYGIESGLAGESAMEAFKELTDFFTAYKLPVTVDFANRFRTGEVPIGIADYTEYNKFELLAPEIKGLWSFSPIPGVLRPDGTVDNTVACTTTQCVMLQTAQEKGVMEDAWTFMRWWMSTEVQTEFATSIEAILGASARYPTANRDVLVKLPWSTADAETLLEQFENTRGLPPLPGHYMTSRMIDYTFKAVVASGANARETLYLKIKEINLELTKKRKEFGLSTVQ